MSDSGKQGVVERVPCALVVRGEKKSVSKGFLGEMTPWVESEGEIISG